MKESYLWDVVFIYAVVVAGLAVFMGLYWLILRWLDK